MSALGRDSTFLPAINANDDINSCININLRTEQLGQSGSSIDIISFGILMQSLEMANNGVGTLPADLFHLLSVELSSRLDFDTLYNCVASSKQIASSGAISALYR